MTLEKIIESLTMPLDRNGDTAFAPRESLPNNMKMIDVHFINVGVNKDKALSLKNEICAELDKLDAEQMASGPSYITLGGMIGDQGMALRLFALGEVIGLWDVIIPAKLGITGEKGDILAGQGYVMISGYKKDIKNEKSGPSSDAMPATA